MTSQDSTARILNSVPGTYTFRLADYLTTGAFLSSMRQMESICLHRSHQFVPGETSDDLPYEVVTVVIPENDNPARFEACSIKVRNPHRG